MASEIRPQTDRRLTRKLLLVAAGLAVAVIFSAAVVRLAHVLHHRSALDAGTWGKGGEKYLQFEWKMRDGKTTEITPSLMNVFAGARPVTFWFQYPAHQRPDPERLRAVAEALKYFGTLEDMTITYGEPETMILFTGIGTQPHMHGLQCIGSPFSDEHSKTLSRFPQLHEMTLSSWLFTGKDFPPLPNLENVDMSSCPIDVEGLRAITMSPQLTDLKITNHPSPTAPLHEEIERLKKSRPELRIDSDWDVF